MGSKEDSEATIQPIQAIPTRKIRPEAIWAIPTSRSRGVWLPETATMELGKRWTRPVWTLLMPMLAPTQPLQTMFKAHLKTFVGQVDRHPSQKVLRRTHHRVPSTNMTSAFQISKDKVWIQRVVWSGRHKIITSTHKWQWTKVMKKACPVAPTAKASSAAWWATNSSCKRMQELLNDNSHQLHIWQGISCHPNNTNCSKTLRMLTKFMVWIKVIHRHNTQAPAHWRKHRVVRWVHPHSIKMPCAAVNLAPIYHPMSYKISRRKEA